MIRPFDAKRDSLPVYSLWQRSLGGAWPLPYEGFVSRLLDPAAYRPGDHLVAETDGEVVGFAATQAPEVAGDQDRCGELMLVMVDPTHRRQGIGRRLHGAAVDVLRERGAREVQLGAGGLSYFWPGVPINLPDARAFFGALGWRETGPIYDLIGDLRDSSTPAWVYDRVRDAGVTLHTPRDEDAGDLLEFVGRRIPHWRIFYQEYLAAGGLPDVVVAKDERGGIVGSSYAMDARANGRRYDFCAWRELLGDQIGGVGPLLVDDGSRERGIGLALAARVTEKLKAKGLGTSFVGYTWLADWYGKLGYRTWREYRQSRRML